MSEKNKVWDELQTLSRMNRAIDLAASGYAEIVNWTYLKSSLFVHYETMYKRIEDSMYAIKDETDGN